MTSKQFFKYLLEPDQMNDSSVVEMEQLIKQFPFFQTGHMLYLKALSKISDKLVKEKLPTESLYISDRAKLYALLNTKKAKPAAGPGKESHAQQTPKTEAKVETEAAKTPKAEPAKAGEKKETAKPEPETQKKEEAPAPKKEAPAAETQKTVETKVETKTETKVETKAEPKAESNKEKATAAASLTNEERKQNHERLVKDFFEINEIEKYETVATNIAEDGSIKSAAAELSARAKADPTLEATAATATTSTKKVVEETKIESASAENKTKEKPAEAQKESASAETKTTEKPAEAQKESASAENKTKEKPAENKDQIFEKIAALRKEQEEADKKRIEAEEEARKLALKLQAEEAERLAKEAEAKAKAKEAGQTTVTETVTVQTVTVETATTTTEPAAEIKAEEPGTETKAEETEQESAKPVSAADKLLARLSKMKQQNPQAAKSNPDSLIERFLQAEPHLDRNKKVQEGDMGEDSNKQPDLYSEKLARLYIQQGHYDKALESYEQLNLKYPEKSAYFAAKIEEIKKLMNNNQ